MSEDLIKSAIKHEQGTPEYTNNMLQLETKRIGDASIKDLLSIVAYRCQGGVTICFASPSVPKDDEGVEVDIGISGAGRDVAAGMLRLNEVVAEAMMKGMIDFGHSEEGNA